jgi:hypothetical protein
MSIYQVICCSDLLRGSRSGSERQRSREKMTTMEDLKNERKWNRTEFLSEQCINEQV